VTLQVRVAWMEWDAVDYNDVSYGHHRGWSDVRERREAMMGEIRGEGRAGAAPSRLDGDTAQPMAGWIETREREGVVSWT
jgi:hypothetical protein